MAAKRFRVASDLLHQFDAIAVGGGFGVAGIRRTQHRLGRDHDGAAADKIAEHHAEQKRQARALQHRAGAVAMHDMAHFMGDDAGQVIRRLALRQ